MQHQITVAGNNKAELVRGLQAHLAMLNGTDATSTATTASATTRGRGGSKKQEADPSFGEDPQWNEEEETQETASDDTEETEAEETTEEETEAEAEDATVTTDDVRKACGAYSSKLIKGGMSMADAKAQVRAVLKKNFKVTLVDQLDEAQYEKAIAVLTQAAKKSK